MIRKIFKAAGVCLLVGGLWNCFEVNNAHAMLKSDCDYKGAELAEQGELVIDNFKVEVVGENCVKIIGYAGNSIPKDLRIPGTLSNGFLVDSIGDRAFAGCNTIKSLKIGGDAIKIGAEAFAGCNNIEDLEFTGNVIKIEYGAFKNCSTLYYIDFNKEIGEIGEMAFANCSSLFLASHNRVAEKVYPTSFENCNNLTEKNIPDVLSKDPLCVAIYNDDAGELQQILVYNNIDINKTVDLCYYLSFEDSCLSRCPDYTTLSRTPLISCCALFGSVNCFKYLMLNKAELNFSAKETPGAPNINLTPMMALCSGNAEIINLLEQKGYLKDLKDSCLGLACLTSNIYSRSENSLRLLKWLMDLRPDLIATERTDALEVAIREFVRQKLPKGCYIDGVYYPIVDKEIVGQCNDAVIQLIETFKNKNPELHDEDTFHYFLCCCGLGNKECLSYNHPFIERVIFEYNLK